MVLDWNISVKTTLRLASLVDDIVSHYTIRATESLIVTQRLQRVISVYRAYLYCKIDQNLSLPDVFRKRPSNLNMSARDTHCAISWGDCSKLTINLAPNLVGRCSGQYQSIAHMPLGPWQEILGRPKCRLRVQHLELAPHRLTLFRCLPGPSPW